MFASVIPLGASFGTEPLTYFVGDSFRSKVQVGQLVQIPYGKKTLMGIIAGLQDFVQIEDAKIKPLEAIVCSIPLLAPYQITSILRLSQKYIIPIHKSLSIFFPTPLLNRLTKYQFPLVDHQNTKHSESENAFYIAKDDIISPQMLVPFLSESIVMIMPDDIYLERFARFFEGDEKFSSKIAIIRNEMTDTKRSQAWIDIFCKKTPIIIGTRRLLQYNLSAYDEIWYFEDAFSSEYFQYPIRLQYADFLAHIVDSGQFSLKIFTSIPQIQTLSQFHFFRLFHL